jgi:hypothetical protein
MGIPVSLSLSIYRWESVFGILIGIFFLLRGLKMRRKEEIPYKRYGIFLIVLAIGIIATFTTKLIMWLS